MVIFLAGVLFFTIIIKSQNSSKTFSNFRDPEVKNFNIKYDPSIWSVENDDNRECSETSCSDPMGRHINFISKKYDKKLIVKINISPYEESPIPPQGKFTTMCFTGPYELIPLRENWYRARNPGMSIMMDDVNKSWDKYNIEKNALSIINGNKCIENSLYGNQKPTQALWQGKKTIITAKLLNSVSENMSSAGDEIIESISYR